MKPSPLHLTYDEAEAVAADLVRVWQGIVGARDVPQTEQVADLVQYTLRKAREAIAARPEQGEGGGV